MKNDKNNLLIFATQIFQLQAMTVPPILASNEFLCRPDLPKCWKKNLFTSMPNSISGS